jgi:hypothetical protein
LFNIFRNSQFYALFYFPKIYQSTITSFLFKNQNYYFILTIFLTQLFALFLANKLQDKNKKIWINFNQIFFGLLFLPILLIILFILLIDVSTFQIKTNI